MNYGEYPIFIPGGHYDYAYGFDIGIATYQGILASNYVWYSDVRIKKNIVDVDDDNFQVGVFPIAEVPAGFYNMIFQKLLLLAVSCFTILQIPMGQLAVRDLIWGDI